MPLVIDVEEAKDKIASSAYAQQALSAIENKNSDGIFDYSPKYIISLALMHRMIGEPLANEEWLFNEFIDANDIEHFVGYSDISFDDSTVDSVYNAPDYNVALEHLQAALTAPVQDDELPINAQAMHREHVQTTSALKSGQLNKSVTWLYDIRQPIANQNEMTNFVVFDFDPNFMYGFKVVWSDQNNIGENKIYGNREYGHHTENPAHFSQAYTAAEKDEFIREGEHAQSERTKANDTYFEDNPFSQSERMLDVIKYRASALKHLISEVMSPYVIEQNLRVKCLEWQHGDEKQQELSRHFLASIDSDAFKNLAIEVTLSYRNVCTRDDVSKFIQILSAANELEVSGSDYAKANESFARIITLLDLIHGHIAEPYSDEGVSHMLEQAIQSSDSHEGLKIHYWQASLAKVQAKYPTSLAEQEQQVYVELENILRCANLEDETRARILESLESKLADDEALLKRFLENKKDDLSFRPIMDQICENHPDNKIAQLWRQLSPRKKSRIS